MTEAIFKAIAFLLGIYALLPTALSRLLHIGVICRGPQNEGRVAITFDDGPHPEYTPWVLDILKQFQVKACFFVLGEKAKEYPELLLRIQTEGHEIASHGYRHHISWLAGPRGIKQDVRQASSIITEITGRPPRFYRPPWGLFNLFSLPYYRLYGQQVVLWSFMSWDWNRRSTAGSIARKVLLRTQNGSILVFHDSDDVPWAAPGAPAAMINALPVILTELKQRGLQVISLSELTSSLNRKKSKLSFRLWQRWEKLLLRLLRIEDVLEDGRPTVFRLALRRYKGRQLLLPDGTTLQKGDMVGELHLNNDVLQQISSNNEPAQLGLAALKKTLQSLPSLAGWIAANPRYREIKAITGLTILHRGSQFLGFSAFDVPPLARRLTRWYEGFLLTIFHPAGRRRFTQHKKKLSPKLLVMSKDELLRKHLT